MMRDLVEWYFLVSGMCGNLRWRFRVGLWVLGVEVIVLLKNFKIDFSSKRRKLGNIVVRFNENSENSD